MDITVIIAVRDRAALLPRTLDSVAVQTRLPDRLVVVDNGSTDSTPEVIAGWAKSHPGITVITAEEPRPGASVARNAGLALAPDTDDSYVMFFDSDDIMLPLHIGRVAAALERDGAADLLFFDIAIRDADGWTTVKSTPGDAPLVREHIFHATLSTQRYAARVSLVRSVGGWNEDLPRWNDYELGLRLAVAASHAVKLTGEPSVVVLPQDESITGDGYAKDADALNRALDCMRRTLAAAEMRQDLRYLHARRAILAALLAREGAREDGRRTLDEALKASASGHDALALRLAWLSTRLTGRGGASIASWLLAPRTPRRLRK